MNKQHALRLLGGSPTSAAKAIGISTAAVSQWPEKLPPTIEDRVVAAVARRLLPPETFADPSCEIVVLTPAANDSESAHAA